MELHIDRIVLSLAGICAGSFLAGVTFLMIFSLPLETNPLENLGFPALSVGVGMGTLCILMLSLPCGLLIHALLYAIKRHDLITYVVVAEVAMTIAAALAHTGDSGPAAYFSGIEAIAAVPTAVCAVAAWLIRRPDKDRRSLKEKTA